MGQPVVHFEIVGTDGEKLRSYYSDLFGWEFDTNNPMNYGIVDNGGDGINGGVAAAPDGNGHVTFYVRVPDINDTLAKVEELGGKTVMPRQEIPGGGVTLGLFTDPEGHLIGLTEGS